MNIFLDFNLSCKYTKKLKHFPKQFLSTFKPPLNFFYPLLLKSCTTKSSTFTKSIQPFSIKTQAFISCNPTQCLIA
ncbi:hypothetical protein HPMG_01584 [Helicobacter pullorum MIT 98-5489]|uniref:Uncharacterized protein n=1 Tax=Helicobacter pullorum MIT 98-5489 TaxID=537972 RepID=C5F1H5_9HELI|nr:hypothetical protein HPMG_01584 [Helicobacter pullorum MIT 98-5489]